MRDDLGMSATAYGFALGTFYWAYFLFEVPSDVVMEKVGARLWIARIMATWGLLACATAFVTGATGFGVVRFLLGAAEAGFFPGALAVFHILVPELSSCSDCFRVSNRAPDSKLSSIANGGAQR